MKINIINNGSNYLDNIVSRVSGHSYRVVDYAIDRPLRLPKADLIILSGGMKKEVTEAHSDGKPWYRHEFDLINNTTVPIFGICLGLQMTTVALGGTLKKMPVFIEANKSISVNELGMRLLKRDSLYVHKKHQWVAETVHQTGLQVLATSAEGIEVIHHPKKRIIATQFHPEIDADEHSEQLFWDLIRVVA